MSVGILIVCHGHIGTAIVDSVRSIIGTLPLEVRILDIPTDMPRERLVEEGTRAVEELDQGDGVLVLTDLYGSTPANVACLQNRENVTVVAGLNLPMLLRVMNYPDLDLPALVGKAISGGRDGILICPRKDQP